MTDRIRAALEAADKATPGQWVAELCLGGGYVIDNTLPENKGKVRRIAEVYGHLSTPFDATLIAAAPDMAAEIVKLRKWQSEALSSVKIARMQVCHCNDKKCVDRRNFLDRIIAEAKETQE